MECSDWRRSTKQREMRNMVSRGVKVIDNQRLQVIVRPSRSWAKSEAWPNPQPSYFLVGVSCHQALSLNPLFPNVLYFLQYSSEIYHPDFLFRVLWTEWAAFSPKWLHPASWIHGPDCLLGLQHWSRQRDETTHSLFDWHDINGALGNLRWFITVWTIHYRKVLHLRAELLFSASESVGLRRSVDLFWLR